MLRRGFAAELGWFSLWGAVAALTGFLTGHFLLALLLYCLAFIAWQFSRVYRLANWVNRARRQQAPIDSLSGIWADIADDVQLMLNRHEKEKLRLAAVVHRVQEMTTALSDGVILVDSRGNIEWWNRSAAELFKFRDTDYGQKITNLIRFPKFVRYYEAAIFDEPLDYQLPLKQDLQVEFLVHPFGQGERLIVVRDISRLTKLESMRKDFVANVSHELRTPLTVLCGYLETLLDADSTPPHWQKALANMQGQTRRMTALITDLLTLSRLETDEKEHSQDSVQLLPLLENIAQDARRLSGDKSHEINVICKKPLAIYGRESEIRSAIANLVFNAVHYTPAQGQIVLMAEQTPHSTRISVSDNGEGIDPKHIPRLTERFYRVDPSRANSSGGTGLGLAIVKHILLRHNAELIIQSALGKGSRFTCVFPPARTLPAPTDAQS